MFIDSHCHFDFLPFCNELNSLKNVLNVGIQKIVVPCVNLNNFDKVLSLANQNAPIFAAIGLHPIYSHKKTDLKKLENLLSLGDFSSKKIVAIGEIGLDRYVNSPNFSEQEYFFVKQLEFAKKFDLPVLLHAFRAHDDVFAHLKQMDLKKTGVNHGFSGDYLQAKRFVDLGFFIGVSGMITNPKYQNAREAISKLPLSSLLLETDSPDLPLFWRKNEPNRPEFLPEIFHFLCEIRTESPKIIQQTILENTKKLFNF